MSTTSPTEAPPPTAQVQPPPAPTSYGNGVNADDVLLGRGAPSVHHEGNIRFRELIKEHSAKYAIANRQQGKDKIARKVVESVHARRGRFLQRIDIPGSKEGIAWQPCSDEETVLDKVKQAFRDTRSIRPKKGKNAIRAAKQQATVASTMKAGQANIGSKFASVNSLQAQRRRLSLVGCNQTLDASKGRYSNAARAYHQHASMMDHQLLTESHLAQMAQQSLLSLEDEFLPTFARIPQLHGLRRRQMGSLTGSDPFSMASIAGNSDDRRRRAAMLELEAARKRERLQQQLQVAKAQALREQALFLGGVPQAARKRERLLQQQLQVTKEQALREQAVFLGELPQPF